MFMAGEVPFEAACVSEAHRPSAGTWWGYGLVRSLLPEQLLGQEKAHGLDVGGEVTSGFGECAGRRD